MGGYGIHGSAGLATHGGSGWSVTYQGNHQISNLINYDRFYEHCYPTGTGLGFLKHRIQAVSFHDYQTSAPHIDSRSWATCHTYFKSSYYKSQGTDQTFGAGVTTPFIDLSVEVGYSRDFKVTWTVPSTTYAKSYGDQFCGSTSSGFSSAPFGGIQAGSSHGAATGSTPNSTADGATCPIDSSDVADGDAAEVDTTATDANC